MSSIIVFQHNILAGGDGDSSCYTNYNTRGDLHGNCGPTGVSTYTACSAR